MFDFEALKTAQKKVQARDDVRLDKSNQACLEALDILALVQRKPHFAVRYLQDAAQKLIQSLEYSRSNVTAYICLASIFLFLEEPKKARKYLKSARSINPDLPEIRKLEKMIEDKIAVSPFLENTKPEPTENTEFKERRFQA